MRIQTGEYLTIHSLPQWVTLRGDDIVNPALMMVFGAGAGMCRLGPFFALWERDFTLVQWDQPGAGATAARSNAEATGPLSFARLAHDGIAVAEAALERLGRRRLVLMGASAGSVVALMMLKARPDLFSAYVAQGQITNWAAQEAHSYALILAEARARGDAAAIAEIEAVGPPPYHDLASAMVKGRYANAATPLEQAAYAEMIASLATPDPSCVPEGATLPDIYATAGAAYAQIMDELNTFDAAAMGLEYSMPLVFIQGVEDKHTPTREVAAFAARVRAPSSRLVDIPGAGHSACFLRGTFLATLAEHVRPFAPGANKNGLP